MARILRNALDVFFVILLVDVATMAFLPRRAEATINKYITRHPVYYARMVARDETAMMDSFYDQPVETFHLCLAGFILDIRKEAR